MHVLVTSDTLSGTWTYTREMVTGLVTRGVQVTLVSFGEIPLPEQTAWMDNLHGLDYRPTAFRLEWMQEAERDLPDSSRFLAALVQELRPDVLHLNQFCYGDLPVDVPRVESGAPGAAAGAAVRVLLSAQARGAGAGYAGADGEWR